MGSGSGPGPILILGAFCRLWGPFVGGFWFGGGVWFGGGWFGGGAGRLLGRCSGRSLINFFLKFNFYFIFSGKPFEQKLDIVSVLF